ncbi:MAG: phosphatase PAP2 family protein [Ruminococcus sp.]|nr:phosphatase PAP2 family protein [Ruminococcus sp.]
MKSIKSIVLLHIGIMLMFGIFIAVGTGYDRDISDALYLPLNTPVLILTTIGQYIPFAAFNFFDGVLFGQVSSYEGFSKKKKTALLVFIAYLSVSTGAIGTGAVTHEECLFAFPAIEQLPRLLTYSLVFVISMMPPFFAGITCGKGGYDKRLTGRLIRVLVFLTAVAYLCGIIKSFFSRPRYRTTLTVTEFLPWYKAYDPDMTAKLKAEIFGTTKNAFESFPSGHALMNIAAVSFFPAFAWVFPKLKDHRTALFFAGLVYGMIIMLTRIILGAHFLTDVSFGALIATVMSLIYQLFEHHKEKAYNDA